MKILCLNLKTAVRPIWKLIPSIVSCFKVAKHNFDMLRVKTQSHASLNTSCIVNLFNPIEL